LLYTSLAERSNRKIPNQTHRQWVGIRWPGERWGRKALELPAHADKAVDAAGPRKRDQERKAEIAEKLEELTAPR